MGKVLSILIGLALAGVGVWLIVAVPGVRESVSHFVKGGLVIMAILIGLGILLFGLSELRAGPVEPPAPQAPSGPEGPTS